MEGRQRLEGALSASTETLPDVAIQALVGLMHLASFQGDVAASRDFAARCLRTARRAGDVWPSFCARLRGDLRVRPGQLPTLHCTGERSSRNGPQEHAPQCAHAARTGIENARIRRAPRRRLGAGRRPVRRGRRVPARRGRGMGSRDSSVGSCRAARSEGRHDERQARSRGRRWAFATASEIAAAPVGARRPLPWSRPHGALRAAPPASTAPPRRCFRASARRVRSR